MPSGGKRNGAGRKPGPSPQTKRTREAIRQHRTLTAESVIEAIRRGCQWDPRDLYRSDNSLKSITELTAEQAYCIAGFKAVRRNIAAGDRHTDDVFEYKLIDRAKYVEMAARYHGLFHDNLTVTDATALEAMVQKRRQRAASKPD